MESDVNLFQTVGVDRMVGPFGVVASPFQPTTFGAVVVGPPPC